MISAFLAAEAQRVANGEATRVILLTALQAISKTPKAPIWNDVVARNKSRKQRKPGLYFRNVCVRRRNAQEKKMFSRVIEGLRLAGSIRHRLLGVYHVWLHLCDTCNLPPPPTVT